MQVGGATGRIGDPSGRATERALLGEATLERNVRGIESCLRLLDTEGGPAFKIVNNFDWYRDMNVLSFLRDVGKHFRLGTMLSKVRSRVARAHTLERTLCAFASKACRCRYARHQTTTTQPLHSHRAGERAVSHGP
jgi:tyrosyl-tRNA synthetase